tara:strand:- start:1759 stop:1941 length:183 start_codon:yes stop_codon:yes gene_type:complete
MILIVFTNSWYVRDNWDLELLQYFWISNTRALKDLRCTEGTSSYDNEFLSLDGLVNRLRQ